MIQFYQKYISPFFHSLTRTIFGSQQGCRFTPTCSEYAQLAFQKYSFPKALLLSAFRILRCNPLSQGGKDLP